MILILAYIFIGTRVEAIAHKKGFGSLVAYAYFFGFTLGTEFFFAIIGFLLGGIWVAIGCAYLSFFFACAAAPSLIDFLPDEEKPSRDDFDTFGRERKPRRGRRRARAAAKISPMVLGLIAGGIAIFGCLGLTGVVGAVVYLKANPIKPAVVRPQHDPDDDLFDGPDEPVRPPRRR